MDDGDANGVDDSETTVVLALELGTLLGDLETADSFTPNGDGINDVMEVGFSLLRLGSSRSRPGGGCTIWAAGWSTG